MTPTTNPMGLYHLNKNKNNHGERQSKTNNQCWMFCTTSQKYLTVVHALVLMSSTLFTSRHAIVLISANNINKFSRSKITQKHDECRC